MLICRFPLHKGWFLDPLKPSEQISVAWVKAQPIVFSYINAMVPDYHAAEDILQVVALTVVRKAEHYDSTKPFLPWAMGIARNEVLHFRRGRSREKLLFNADLMDMLAIDFAQRSERSKEIYQAMGHCLNKLSDRPKEVFRLRYGEEMPVKEIAESLQTTPSSISVTLHRCRQVLRDCLSKRLGGGLWQS